DLNFGTHPLPQQFLIEEYKVVKSKGPYAEVLTGEDGLKLELVESSQFSMQLNKRK
ncbi:hypothetical protein CHS0354_018916, partial [Potamilus streckersoni]